MAMREIAPFPGGFGYAQARAQARCAERVTDGGWAALANVEGYRAFLERARETGLRRWLRGISAHAGPHEIERQLRRELREEIGEAARWAPAPWRAAVAWTAGLVYLPLVRRALAEGMTEAWMRDDPEIAALAARGWASLERWHQEWRKRWPPCGARAREALERLVARVRSHLGSVAGLATAERLSGREVWARRRELQGHAQRLFRIEPLGPAALFGYLLLTALELERLRGELARRAVFAAEAT